MASPFRSEAQAFRFVLFVAAGTVAVIVANAVAGTTVLVVVCVLAAVAVAAAYVVGRPRARRLPAAPAHVGPPDERRALLLLGENVPGRASLAALHERCDRVLVVAPARTSSLRHWASDVDGARDQARARMEDAVSRARAAHLDASGVVGDDDPLAAIEDALRTFGGDEVVAATSDQELLAALRDRYAIPVTSV
jgi:GABA permease